MRLYQWIGCAIDRVIGFDAAARRGSGAIYNVVPMEMEANAAAAGFIRPRVEPVQLTDLESGEQGVLFRRPPELEPIASTDKRMVCAAAIVGEHVEDAFEQGGHPRGRLGAIAEMPDGPAMWSALRADAELQEYGARFEAAVPSTSQIESARPLFGHAWNAAREAWLDAYDRAREVAGLAPAQRPLGMADAT